MDTLVIITPPRFLKQTAVSTPEPDAKAVLRRTWCGCEGFQGPFQSACTPLCFYAGLGDKVTSQS